MSSHPTITAVLAEQHRRALTARPEAYRLPAPREAAVRRPCGGPRQNHPAADHGAAAAASGTRRKGTCHVRPRLAADGRHDDDMRAAAQSRRAAQIRRQHGGPACPAVLKKPARQ
jgi:hypothetical protein